MPKRNPSPDEAKNQAVEEIAGLVDAFCKEHLNNEYGELCRRLTEKLGRKHPARSLPNRFTKFGAQVEQDEIPDYPIAYDAGEALHAAAKAVGEFGYGAQWAGEGAPHARSLPAGDLIARLVRELEAEGTAITS